MGLGKTRSGPRRYRDAAPPAGHSKGVGGRSRLGEVPVENGNRNLVSAQVIEGLLLRRRELYASPAFFNLSSYELVLKDVRYMHELHTPDLIILGSEAQRIRNWATATARTIKQLKSRYAYSCTALRSKQAGRLSPSSNSIDGRR